MMALDLEQYDFSKDAKSLIRATEDTVVERLPARVAVREQAPLEMPHVMVLVSDRENLLMNAAERDRKALRMVYDFDLMLGGGHLAGWLINQPQNLRAIADALHVLLEQSGDGFLYAMGDGNHSFAAAKLYWEKIKGGLTPRERLDHPARYALAEIVNLYDPGLTVEPIHRLLMGVDSEQVQREVGFDASNPPSLQELQPKLDRWLAGHPQAELEYIHGESECRALAAQGPDRLAIIFPAFDRTACLKLFAGRVRLCARAFHSAARPEKRYYLECRLITRQRVSGESTARV